MNYRDVRKAEIKRAMLLIGYGNVLSRFLKLTPPSVGTTIPLAFMVNYLLTDWQEDNKCLRSLGRKGRVRLKKKRSRILEYCPTNEIAIPNLDWLTPSLAWGVLLCY